MNEGHVAMPGECVASIAFEHGLFPETVWKHPKNEELRRKRASLYILSPGDVVFVPDLRRTFAGCSTGARHRFRRRGVPERLSICFCGVDDRPLAALKYKMEVDGITWEGCTDGDGWLREWVSPVAKLAKVLLASGASYTFAIGRLPPQDTAEGLKERLRNLGYHSDSDPKSQAELGTLQALQLFYQDRGLELPVSWDETAIADAQSKVMDVHGS